MIILESRLHAINLQNIKQRLVVIIILLIYFNGVLFKADATC